MGTLAMACLLHKPLATSPIVGATKAKHLSDAVAALDVKLSAEELAELERHYAPPAHLLLKRDLPMFNATPQRRFSTLMLATALASVGSTAFSGHGNTSSAALYEFIQKVTYLAINKLLGLLTACPPRSCRAARPSSAPLRSDYCLCLAAFAMTTSTSAAVT